MSLLDDLKAEQALLDKDVERMRQTAFGYTVEGIEHGHAGPFIVAALVGLDCSYYRPVYRSPSEQEEVFGRLNADLASVGVSATVCTFDATLSPDDDSERITEETQAVIVVTRTTSQHTMKIHPYGIAHGKPTWQEPFEVDEFSFDLIHVPEMN